MVRLYSPVRLCGGLPTLTFTNPFPTLYLRVYKSFPHPVIRLHILSPPCNPFPTLYHPLLHKLPQSWDHDIVIFVTSYRSYIFSSFVKSKNDDISWVRKCVQQRMARTDARRHDCLDCPLILYTCHQRILSYAPSNVNMMYSVWKLWTSQKWWYLMNKEAHKGADDTSRCSKTHLLRSRSNIICVAAKNFEICAFVYACTGVWIHARVCPYTRGNWATLEQPLEPACSDYASAIVLVAPCPFSTAKM